MKEIFNAVGHTIIGASRSKYFFYLAVSLLYLVVGYSLLDPTNFRWVVVCVIIFLLFVVTVSSVHKGIIGILLFLAFMAFLRRAVYSVSPYAKYDPIHLVAPVLVLFLFGGIVLFDRERLSQAIKGNNLAKYIVALLGLFVLQVFNPLQGSLLVGFGGILYYVIPAVWFFLALYYADNQLLHKLLTTIVAIAVVTGAYGLWQMSVGFLPFERYWIEHGGFASLHVGRFIRAFSTFSSPEEYSRYLQVGGVIAFGYFLKRKNLAWFLLFVFISISTVMAGVRSSVFGLASSVLVFLVIWRIRDLRRAFVRLILLASAFVAIMSFLSPPPSGSIYQSQSVFYTMAGHTARGFFDPLAERTFHFRLKLWQRLLTDIVPRNPFGYGLGSTSIAAQKFGSLEIGTEGYIFALFVNSGVIGGLLFLIISLAVLKKGIYLCAESEGGEILVHLVLAIIVGLFLNNVFGSSFALYSVAPIGWFLIGYLARQTNSQTKVQQDG